MTVIFMIFIAIFLKVFYKMNWSGVFSIIIFAIGSYFIYTDTVYYFFFVAFVFLGFIKLLRYLKTGFADVNKYGAYTFICTMCIPLILGIFRIEALVPIIFCCIGALLIDTTSGELGQTFKGRTYTLIPFKKAPLGTEGGISLIGTLLGLLCGVIYIFGMGFISEINHLFIILIISFLGNMVDSISGSLLQKKGLINNNQNNLVAMIFVTIISTVIFLIIL